MIALVTSRMVDEERLRRRARQHLATFVRLTWPVLNPQDPLEWGWHHDVICDHVSAALDGAWAGRWLLITCPPGESKSTILTRCAPAWRWLDHPWTKFYTISHNEELSIRLNVDRRKILASDYYQWLRKGWPSTSGPDVPDARWRITRGDDQKRRYDNTGGGYCSVAYPEGQAPLGHHPHVQLFDDLATPDPDKLDPDSWASRYRFATRTMASRFGNRATGVSIMLGQRIGEHDPQGRLLDEYADGVVHLNLRREYRTTYSCPCRRRRQDLPRCTTPLGFDDPRTVDGDLLEGTRMTRAMLDRMDPMERATQQNQESLPAEGRYFTKGAWGSWRRCSDALRVIITADTGGGSESTEASPNAVQAWGLDLSAAFGKKQYTMRLLDELHFNGDPLAVERAVMLFCRRWPGARRRRIEAKALGPSVIASLRRMGAHVDPVNPQKGGSKTQRALSWYRFQSHGFVLLPSADAARPPGIAAPVDPDTLLALPYVGELKDVREDAYDGRYRAAMLALLDIDPMRLTDVGRDVLEAITAVVCGGWEPISREDLDAFKAEFATVPAGSRWDRVDAAWMAADYWRPRLTRQLPRATSNEHTAVEREWELAER